MKNLKKLRELARITQIRLSLKAGVSRQRIQLAETGQGGLTVQEQQRLREVLLREIQRQAAALDRAVAQEQQAEVPL
jgi:transcriptional regulator with XRE-family HTH domain